MVVYVVTGASRGLGYEFVRQLSQGDNVVLGLVRTKAPVEKKVSEDGLKNVHILSADVTDTASLRAARAEVEKISPVVDVLINNAAALSPSSVFNSLSDFEDDPAVLDQEMNITFQTNVLGVVKSINTFLPLVKKSSIKKVVSITSGLADDNLTNDYDLYEAGPYTISKAALNTVVAKYNARHGKSSDGILFVSISPGMVDTGHDGQPPPNSTMPQKFAKAFPHFTGPITPEESVKAVMAVIEKAKVDSEYAGEFVSHFGNKVWL
ncbi:MAG: hypothetical protein M1835_002437 [Candelina submexicana]|nr:MAG: hypothetical protein M1835_002437 [Candelina submexicana]